MGSEALRGSKNLFERTRLKERIVVVRQKSKLLLILRFTCVSFQNVLK